MKNLCRLVYSVIQLLQSVVINCFYRSHLECHFHELYFMPEMPELADVNAVLRSYMKSTYR